MASTKMKTQLGQFEDPKLSGVEHGLQMKSCEQEIAKLVKSILNWKWTELRVFEGRWVRVGQIRYVSNEGLLKQDRFVCTFDKLVGDDFYIGN